MSSMNASVLPEAAGVVTWLCRVLYPDRSTVTLLYASGGSSVVELAEVFTLTPCIALSALAPWADDAASESSTVTLFITPSLSIIRTDTFVPSVLSTVASRPPSISSRAAPVTTCEVSPWM